MSLVSEIWTWQEGDRLYSRITTNIVRARMLSRLDVLGLLDSAEVIYAYFGDRIDGGSGYEVHWKERTRWEDLRLLGKL